jgi:pimeloyl-ACP methyl ester carboxylesterase
MILGLPGMGADQRMYPSPWTRLNGFRPVDWSGTQEARDLTELAAIVVEKQGILDGDVLVGASLGGMVACEITKLRRIPQLFLVGSATHRGEINPWLTALSPLAGIAPMDWLRISAGKVPGELAAMFAASDAKFIRTMCTAIPRWDGLGTTSTRVFRIHGRNDLVISAPPDTDLLLEGGHLISMTHASDCVAFVERNLPA